MEALSDQVQQLLAKNMSAAECFLRLPSMHIMIQQVDVHPQLCIQVVNAYTIYLAWP